MSTIWRGLCLSHNPVIEFDLFDGQYECKSAEAAFASLMGNNSHSMCEVMLGGFSYPLVRVGCPGIHHGLLHRGVPQWDVMDLRLVLAAQGTDAAAEWLRRNNCWTIERLNRVLGVEMPEDAPRPGSRAALEQAIRTAGWDITTLTVTGIANTSYVELKAYPRSTINNEGK